MRVKFAECDGTDCSLLIKKTWGCSNDVSNTVLRWDTFLTVWGVWSGFRVQVRIRFSFRAGLQTDPLVRWMNISWEPDNEETQSSTVSCSDSVSVCFGLHFQDTDTFWLSTSIQFWVWYFLNGLGIFFLGFRTCLQCHSRILLNPRCPAAQTSPILETGQADQLVVTEHAPSEDCISCLSFQAACAVMEGFIGVKVFSEQTAAACCHSSDMSSCCLTWLKPAETTKPFCAARRPPLLPIKSTFELWFDHFQTGRNRPATDGLIIIIIRQQNPVPPLSCTDPERHSLCNCQTWDVNG